MSSETTHSSLGRLARSVVRPLLISGAAMILLDLARRIFRRSQLFCPSENAAISWNPADYGIDPSRCEEHWIESDDGELLYSWYCRAEHPIASALFCHGNTGNLTNNADTIPYLLAAGINVLLFDYRGFGRSSGIPSFGGLIADGVAAAQHHEQLRPRELPSILYGYSLGGAVAAQVLKRFPFDGLILQSTFTNLAELARANFPNVPLHLVAGSELDTVSAIRSLTTPLLVMHGSKDEVCPADMAQRLFDLCGNRDKQLYIVQDGLHKDLFLREARSLVEAVRRFAAALAPLPLHIAIKSTPTEQIVDSMFRWTRRHMRGTVAPKPL